MKWFVYVDAEYYAETHVIEAATPQEAAALAIEQTRGATYARYQDEGTPIQPSPHEIRKEPYRDGYATPACAVMPFDDVVFTGSANRVAYLREEHES